MISTTTITLYHTSRVEIAFDFETWENDSFQERWSKTTQLKSLNGVAAYAYCVMQHGEAARFVLKRDDVFSFLRDCVKICEEYQRKKNTPSLLTSTPYQHLLRASSIARYVACIGKTGAPPLPLDREISGHFVSTTCTVR